MKMWPFDETEEGKKKKKARKKLMKTDNRKPFPGNLQVGIRAIRNRQKRMKEEMQ